MKIHYQSVFETWEIEDKSVQVLITSPPYYSLRKYSIPDVIIGGDKNCKHEWNGKERWLHRGTTKSKLSHVRNAQITEMKTQDSFCIHCNCWRGQHGLEPSYKLYLEHCKLWMQEAIRVLRDDGVIFVNLADTYNGGGRGWQGKNSWIDKSAMVPPMQQKDYSNKSKLLIPERFAIMCCDELGLILRNHICWYKPNGMPESCQDRFSKKWESILMFVKSSNTLCWKHDKTNQWVWEKPEPDYYFVDGKRRNRWQGFDYYFDLDAVREPWDKLSIARLYRGNNEGQKYSSGEHGQSPCTMSTRRPNRTHEYKTQDPERKINIKGKNPGDVFIIPTQPSPERHFAMWPEKLVERMILCSTKVGDTVLDPFCGSGTTLRVADRLNRVGKGLELGYKDIQDKRLSEIQKELIL